MTLISRQSYSPLLHEYFGPVRNAFEALPEEQRPNLQRDLVALWTEHNRATDETTWVSSEYLEVVATRA